MCTPQFAWDGSVGWEARCFFLTLSSAAIQAVTFSDLNPTGLLPCVAPLLLPLTHALRSR